MREGFGGHMDSVQFIEPGQFARVLHACDNPPAASPTLKALVAKGRQKLGSDGGSGF